MVMVADTTAHLRIGARRFAAIGVRISALGLLPGDILVGVMFPKFPGRPFAADIGGFILFISLKPCPILCHNLSHSVIVSLLLVIPNLERGAFRCRKATLLQVRSGIGPRFACFDLWIGRVVLGPCVVRTALHEIQSLVDPCVAGVTVRGARLPPVAAILCERGGVSLCRHNRVVMALLVCGICLID